MKINQISFYDQFNCIGQGCPENCCMGWFIPLTAEDIKRLRRERGMLGLRLFAATGGWQRDHFNEDCRYCPFLNKENLCHLQLKKGHSFIPEVCREYPRFYRNYGPLEERYLDLSCPVVCGLFYDNMQDLHISSTQEEPFSGCYITNDDPVLLQRLLTIRDELLAALSNLSGYEDLQKTLLAITAYAGAMQHACLNYDASLESLESFETFRRRLEEGQIVLRPSDPVLANAFPFHISVYNRLMGSSFYHENLSFSNATLHGLCRLFLDDFSRQLSTQKGWEKLANAYFLQYPEHARLYGAYLAYYLFMYFLRTYETYSFVKQVRTGLIHTNMVFLFHVLFSQKKQKPVPADLIRIISVYNRRAYFSDSVLDDMYKALDS